MLKVDMPKPLVIKEKFSLGICKILVRFIKEAQKSLSGGVCGLIAGACFGSRGMGGKYDGNVASWINVAAKDLARD